ncbi:Rid family hydrolase [Streptomyces sp. NPDC000618]|uniref:RidA family protein n=1 Tax=Streptomyces sp. NPDC000618 TaxID=3154265 RepID=UPI00331C4D86
MPKKIIDTGSSLGPYSSAVVAGNHLYVAGHCGFLPGTPDIAEGGLEAEFRQTLKNLEATILQAGFRLEDVVSTTCYLRDMDHWPLLNEIYSGYFAQDVPARAAVAVVGLPLGANLEITCVAWRDDTGTN